jgi:serine/threonine protein kinase
MSSRDNTGTPPASAIVSGYEQLWRTAGTMPDLVSYVAATPRLDARDLAALVHIDQRHRHATGALLPAETYFERFPVLRDNNELALDVVYQEYVLRGEAGEVYPTDKYLVRFPDLAERLAMQFELDSALGDGVSPATVGAQATVESSPADPTETIIAGRYKLLEEIGEGGMGTVWMAQQTDPVRRRVALKLIKPGMDSRQVLLRFEAERQALALMDHPHIAKVFDGGVTRDGRPFFVMEYVKGQPITDYCDQFRLSIPERLKLFVQVCQAVQHAHQKGIIHRDLKPSNILVCPFDGQPVPKVIDFGLAKAMHQGLTDRSLFTGHGTMLGTPLYMSPEQAETNNLDIDTRCDVYSLGVVLYELLTGSTPLEKRRFQDAAWQEMLRLIKEEEPTKPSTKISGSGSLPTIAAQRSLEPAQLSRMIRGDLDWIVMKSLEKERSRRYETANGLARDIERYLHDDPVEARPPSTGYRFRKFARRNKATLLTLLVISTALIVGTAVSTWQAVRATRAENLAESRLGAETEARLAETEQRKVAEQARGDAERERVEAEKQRGAAAANFEGNLAVLLARRGELSRALSEAQAGVRHGPFNFDTAAILLGVLNRIGDDERTLTVLRECVAAEPTSSVLHFVLASALGQQNLDEEAVAELQASIRHEPSWEWPRLTLVEELLKLGRTDQALTETLGIQIAPEKEARPRLWLGQLLARQGQHDCAVECVLGAIEKEPDNSACFGDLQSIVNDCRGGPERSALIAKVDQALANRRSINWLAMRGGWSEIVSEFRKRINAHPEDHDLWFRTACALAVLGDLDAYHVHCREMLARFSDTQNPNVAERVAKSCLLLPPPDDQLARARVLAQRAVDAGPDHYTSRYFQFVHALAEYRAGHFAEAKTWVDRSLEQTDKVFGLYPQIMAGLLRAMVSARLGDVQKARGEWGSLERDWSNYPSLGRGQLLYPVDWHDGIGAELLHREAQRMFQALKDADARKPADPGSAT